MHKTYPEIAALHPAFVIWHYQNAIESKKEEFEKREEDYKYLLYLIRPEIYQKIVPKEYLYESKVSEAQFLDMDADQFDQLTGQAKQYEHMTEIAFGEAASKMDVSNPDIFKEEEYPQLGKSLKEKEFYSNPIVVNKNGR